MASTTVSVPSFAVGEPVSSPDSTLHAVASNDAGGLRTVCGLILGAARVAEPTNSPCADCMADRSAPAAPTLDEPADAPTPEPASADDAPTSEALADAPTSDDDAASDAPTLTYANAPTQAAVDAGVVGHYTIEQPKKDGPYRLRDNRTGKLDPHAFTSRADAGWFAQRRTRLSQYAGFGGTKRLHMPTVPERVGGLQIVGELKAVRVLDAGGQQVGPVWVHPTNGRVDALRWAQRVQRPTHGLLA